MKQLLLAVLSLATIAVKAQTADEVIQKYTNNMGGLDAFNKINTVKITGTYSAQGNDLPLTVEIINGKGVRSDVEVMGQSVTSSYFNGKGWKINPFAGVSTPTEVTGTELNDLKAQCSIATALMDYKARGNQVELLGKEVADGIEAYKIKLTSKDDGRVTTYFITTKDYTLLKSVTSREMQGQQMDVESWYSNLKEINGIKFFMSRESKIEGQVIQSITYDKIELNVPVDEKIFQMP